MKIILAAIAAAFILSTTTLAFAETPATIVASDNIGTTGICNITVAVPVGLPANRKLLLRAMVPDVKLTHIGYDPQGKHDNFQVTMPGYFFAVEYCRSVERASRSFSVSYSEDVRRQSTELAVPAGGDSDLAYRMVVLAHKASNHKLKVLYLERAVAHARLTNGCRGSF